MTQIYRIRVVWDGPPIAGTGLSTFHTNALVAPQDAANLIAGFLNDLQPIISNQITWQLDQTVQTVEDTTGLIVDEDSITATPSTGTATGEVLSRMTQGQVQWRTNAFIAGRRLQGKTFIPGPTETFNDSAGLPTAAYFAELSPAADALAATGQLRVFSRTHFTSAPVQSAVEFENWAVLRSRRD